MLLVSSVRCTASAQPGCAAHRDRHSAGDVPASVEHLAIAGNNTRRVSAGIPVEIVRKQAANST
eukprot:3941177-Rhodomonas_salina.2